MTRENILFLMYFSVYGYSVGEQRATQFFNTLRRYMSFAALVLRNF